MNRRLLSSIHRAKPWDCHHPNKQTSGISVWRKTNRQLPILLLLLLAIPDNNRGTTPPKRVGAMANYSFYLAARTSNVKPPPVSKPAGANVAQVEAEEEEEEKEEAEVDVGVEENPQVDVEVVLDPPAEYFDSRQNKKLLSIMGAPELEEEAELEPMDLETNARLDESPEEEPDEPLQGLVEPPSISPRKKGRKEISFDENSADPQRPPKKPRSKRTPLADRTSSSHHVSVRSGRQPFVIASSTHSLNQFIPINWQPTGVTEES